MIYNSVADIFKQIDETRERLVAAVSNLSEAEENFRPAEDSWTVKELTEHLAKTEASIIPLVFRLLKQAEADGAATATPSDGTINPPISLAEVYEKSKAARFQAPEMIRPDGSTSISESLAKLAESRETIRGVRPRLEAVDLSKTAFPHRAFGNLNLYQWLAFIGLHETRHLEQIEKILAEARESN
ncbi:MAG: DinB family protein [Acidobacteriota bacterium]|nr:DinB family protein [Acidobacteriota bacterium]